MYVPGLVNLNLKVKPASMGSFSPELKVVPSSLVMVWGVVVRFVQITVVPDETVRVSGLNANE